MEEDGNFLENNEKFGQYCILGQAARGFVIRSRQECPVYPDFSWYQEKELRLLGDTRGASLIILTDLYEVMVGVTNVE